MTRFAPILTAVNKPLRLAIVCAAAAAFLTLAPTANAGNYPTYRALPGACEPWTNSSRMVAEYTFLAADRYLNWNGEKQWMYVRAALYSHTEGRIIATSKWVYGLAFDTMTPAVWYDFETDAYLGYHFRHSFIRIPRGSYQIGVEFYWDEGSTGGPEGGSGGWVWAPQICTFNV